MERGFVQEEPVQSLELSDHHHRHRYRRHQHLRHHHRPLVIFIVTIPINVSVIVVISPVTRRQAQLSGKAETTSVKYLRSTDSLCECGPRAVPERLQGARANRDSRGSGEGNGEEKRFP
ncbi:hypothetical protein J1605_013420 [Eschrichtius robustus]|uniref:Uncharacterized protein n=1 Tax=Eschrichtius robustus TaxID=9764 RepID=A0AB34GFN9_ESCRO|nr:hypothetical protein J1605_013420 [Eschrichtius robustus]